jgi:hypothetical protein
MAVQAFNKFPCVVTDLEFKSMMKIPLASKGEMTTFMCLDLKDEDSRLTQGARYCPSPLLMHNICMRHQVIGCALSAAIDKAFD